MKNTNTPTSVALVKKEDGNIYVMNMPEKPIKDYYQPRDEDVVLPFDQEGYDDAMSDYESSLKQALSSAVRCDDQEQARITLEVNYPPEIVAFKTDHPYVIPGLTVSYDTVVPCKAKRDCQEPTNNDDGTITKCISNCKHEYRVALLSLQEKTEKQESQESIWNDIDNNYIRWNDQEIKVKEIMENFTITRKS